jgi:hypothetical protein
LSVLLGAHHIFHVSRIRVKVYGGEVAVCSQINTKQNTVQTERAVVEC